MTRKKLFILSPILLVLGTVLFLFLRAESRPSLLKSIPFTPEARARAERLRLHPLASKEKREAFSQNTPVLTWDDWIDGKVEGMVGFLVEGGGLKTPEEIAAYKAKYRPELVEMIGPFKAAKLPPPTPLKERLPWEKLSPNGGKPTIVQPTPYEGPQTTEALMAAYDAGYVELFPKTLKYDDHYPREEWLQRILDKGIVIENATDYDYYMKSRFYLIQARENPNRWQSGLYGVPSVSSLDAYEDAFIERKRWERQVYKDFRAANPNTPGTIYFPENHPDKYLPVTGKMTYVYRDGPVTRTWGTHLTDEQRNALHYQGVHPEGIEIVYVDEGYNVLTKKPEPYDPKKDGIVVSSEVIFQEGPGQFGEFTPNAETEAAGEFLGDTENYGHNTYETERAQDAAAAAQAVQAEFEKFKQQLRQFEEFANMTDAELTAEIENHFMSQIPTLEKLESKISEQFNPERFSKAMETLNRYGPEEGILRLKETDPAVAKQVERLLKKE